MEDFSTIIWIAVAVIFSALSSIKRKNQRSTAENPPERSIIPESWPLFEVLQQATENSPQKDSNSEQIASDSLEDTSAPEAVSLETIEPEIPQGYTISATEINQATNKRQKTHKEHLVKVPTGSTVSPSSTEEISETADFDLKKAVIYSEILKPKFEDE